MKKHLIIIGFIFIFIFSSVTSMVPGYTAESTKMEEFLDNIRFMCTEPSGFNYGHRY